LSRDEHIDLNLIRKILTQEKFREISSTILVPIIDLFATSPSRQCEDYVSWFPDVNCFAVDAFTISWTNNFYAFPPFTLITRVLNKIIDDRVRGIVVAPNWPSQNWYPIFMRMVDSEIITIEKGTNSIFCPYFNRPHKISSQVSLMVAVLSTSHF